MSPSCCHGCATASGLHSSSGITSACLLYFICWILHHNSDSSWQYGGWNSANVGNGGTHTSSHTVLLYCMCHHLSLFLNTGASKSHRAVSVNRRHRSQNRHQAQQFSRRHAQEVRILQSQGQVQSFIRLFRYIYSSLFRCICSRLFRHCSEHEALSLKSPRKYASIDALLQVKLVLSTR